MQKNKTSRIVIWGLLFLIMGTFLNAQNAPEFGQIWKAQTEAPITTLMAEAGEWNETMTGYWQTYGRVIWDGEQYRYYVSARGPEPNRYYSIGLYFSPHLDSVWVPYENNPVFRSDTSTAGFDDIAAPCVIKEGDSYKMWFNGRNTGEVWHVGYATSQDGYTWSEHSTPVLENDPDSEWESTLICAPFVLKEDDGSYSMWYQGFGGTPEVGQIGYANSTDGITWTRHENNPVLEVDNGHSTWIGFPIVERIEDKYIIWFSGSNGWPYSSPFKIFTGLSEDGLNWRKDYLYGPVVNVGVTGSWSAGGVMCKGVFEEDGIYKMVQGGADVDLEDYSLQAVHYDPTIVEAGDVSGVWTKAGSPYRVQGEITIPDGETLIIEPGATVQFVEPAPLNVLGQILAIGSVDDHILFRVADTLGFHDDLAIEGVWGGIEFPSTPSTNDSSKLSYCDIEFAHSQAGNAVYGGGLRVRGVSKLTVEHCLIQHNRAIKIFAGDYALGGGMDIANGSSPNVVHNTIQKNYVFHYGDAEGAGGSGAGIIIRNDSHPLVEGNTIKLNRATEAGGGVGIWENCNPLLVNNIIVENTAMPMDGTDGAGGGVASGASSWPVLINNTIADNITGWTGGGLYINDGDITIINTIIANNVATDEPGQQGDQVGGWSMGGRRVWVRNSCIENGRVRFDWDASPIQSYSGLLDMDPMLTNTYQLLFYSPCIGKGLAECTLGGNIYSAPDCDCDGRQRPFPAGSSPDMGALESTQAAHIISQNWNWWESPSNPFLTPDPSPAWDDEHVFGCDVLFYDGMYHMWYTGDGGDRWKIGYATSPDGETWRKYESNPVLVAQSSIPWHANSVYAPRVLLIDGVFHMWYETYPNSGHATSTDGITWVHDTQPAFETTTGTFYEDFVFVGDVMQIDDQFVAWVNGKRNGVWKVGRATSPDAVNWTMDADPCFETSTNGWDSQDLYASTVIHNGMQYIMWYAASNGDVYNQIGRASSIDGINWSRNSLTEPDIPWGENGSWDDDATFFPAALIVNGRYEVWYTGSSGDDASDLWSIGHLFMEPTSNEEHQDVEMPETFSLSQNYPNPFNPLTHIRFTLPEDTGVRLVVYDMLGREMIELVNTEYLPGAYQVTWDGADRYGNQVPAGVYFARLEAGRYSDVIKMLYLK